MNKKEKIRIKKERANRRMLKKKTELEEIKRKMSWSDCSFRQARAAIRGTYTFTCTMGYSDCEERGYCNGDC